MSSDGTPRNDSVLGRLLQEVSWEGRTVRRYRDGGSGYENVLTAEVMSALETLPRKMFLGGVIEAATGADDARAQLVAEIEEADLLFLGEYRLGGIEVQPDLELTSPSVLAWVEAKSLRPGATFGRDQLARQAVTLLHEAGDRRPLLMTLTANPPPVHVIGNGRMPPTAAVEVGLDAALELRDGVGAPGEAARRSEALVEQLPGILAWITWEQVGAAVRTGLEDLGPLPASVLSSIQRQADRVLAALEIHGQ